MKILIPSYNRAGNVSTYHKIDDSIIVVPESQYKDYVKHYDKSRLFVIPDKLDGNVARKRNAILDNYPDKEIFMIDDDLINVKEIKTGRKLNSIEFTRLIESGFDIINGLGLHFFGFNWSNQPLHNNPEIPFSFTKRFYAGVGIVKNELRYDESLTRLEDTDYWLQQTRKDKATFRFNNYHVQCKIYSSSKNQKGGITVKSEKDYENTLIKKWGGKVLKYSKKKELLASSPYKGI